MGSGVAVIVLIIVGSLVWVAVYFVTMGTTVGASIVRAGGGSVISIGAVVVGISVLAVLSETASFCSTGTSCSVMLGCSVLHDAANSVSVVIIDSL